MGKRVLGKRNFRGAKGDSYCSNDPKWRMRAVCCHRKLEAYATISRVEY